MMTKLMIQIGYQNSSTALKECRNIPNKFQREFLENKLQRKREESSLVQRVQLLQKHEKIEKRRNRLDTKHRIQDIKEQKEELRRSQMTRIEL